MFREMRRKRQQMEEAEAVAVLERGSSGVLAVLGDGGYPYAVPLSYVYGEGKLWFHCAVEGHKLDAVRRCPKASFCVVDQDQVVPERYTTYFRSVIVFGQIRVMEHTEDRMKAIERLAKRYAPEDTEENRQNTILESDHRLCVLEMTVEHMTGKAARELLS